MGFFLKPRITDSEAARIFLSQLQESVRKSWSRIFEIVRPTLTSRTAVIDNPRAAQQEFSLSVVATHLAELERVFDRARAQRLQALILEALDFGAAGGKARRDPAAEALEAYRRGWEEAIEERDDPVVAVASLLHERLGATFSGRSGSDGTPESLDVAPLAAIVANFGVSWWRYFRQKYRIEKPKAQGD